FTSAGTRDIDVEAERMVDQFLAADPRPTGVFVPVDRVSVRVYRHLERRGIKPGRDVEIVSCDNEKELLSLMHPAPVSIDLNRNTIARLAVERLLWRMKYGVASPRVVVTVTPTVGPDVPDHDHDATTQVVTATKETFEIEPELGLPKSNGNGNGHSNGNG